MRCSLALIWDNEFGEPEVLIEQSEKALTTAFAAACGTACRGTFWQRIKNIFRPISYQQEVALQVTQVIQAFKDKSIKAHFPTLTAPMQKRKPSTVAIYADVSSFENDI